MTSRRTQKREMPLIRHSAGIRCANFLHCAIPEATASDNINLGRRLFQSPVFSTYHRAIGRWSASRQPQMTPIRSYHFILKGEEWKPQILNNTLFHAHNVLFRLRLSRDKYDVTETGDGKGSKFTSTAMLQCCLESGANLNVIRTI